MNSSGALPNRTLKAPAASRSHRRPIPPPAGPPRRRQRPGSGPSGWSLPLGPHSAKARDGRSGGQTFDSPWWTFSLGPPNEGRVKARVAAGRRSCQRRNGNEGVHLHGSARTASCDRDLGQRVGESRLLHRRARDAAGQEDGQPGRHLRPYHLFYADAEGRPGTDLTFFDWPAAPERRGTASVVRTGLRVAGRTCWDGGPTISGTPAPPAMRVEEDGRHGLAFEDPEGQRLLLLDDGGAGDARPWSGSPIPPGQQVRGLGPVTISVRAMAPSETVLHPGDGDAPGPRLPRRGWLRVDRVRHGRGRPAARTPSARRTRPVRRQAGRKAASTMSPSRSPIPSMTSG